MKKIKTYCPYCGAQALLRPASWVHGKSEQSQGKHLYVCSNWPKCDSYVAAHEGDLTPMGTLANSELRHKRILAHKALAKYQKVTGMDRWATYIWLEGKLGLDQRSTHIGLFSEETCNEVIALCKDATESYRNKEKVG